MTLLSDLIDGALCADVPEHVPFTGIAYRSNDVSAGDVFFCIAGLRHDGHDFAADAVARGAAALVCARQLGLGVPECVVPDVRVALARAAARLHGDPSSAIEVLGITGTNGKTTTTYLLDSILRASGRTTGLIGTVETRIAGTVLPSERTTPESADLQALFARMRETGVDAATMEVSSHAIDLHRTEAVRFAAAGFTNLTQDHLDYHGTLDVYWTVKRRLFTELDVAERVMNIDDPRGAVLAAECGTRWTVGRSVSAAVRAEAERLGPVSTTFSLITPVGTAEVVLPLAGAYNVSNALLAAGCALAIGTDLADVVRGLNAAPQVPGRLERIDGGQSFSVFVDYAHTPDSIEKAVAAVRAVTSGRVITVFGCGGDRDPDKRPLMGEAATRGSDITVITSDNPRSEDPEAIIARVLEGVVAEHCECEVEVDRRSAIRRALMMADDGDAVLIAGKGHEDYQIFSDRTIHFDDREVVREELRTRC